MSYCEICNSYPHKAGCPNAPMPKIRRICSICREPLYVDEDYYDVPGYNEVHVDCAINDLSQQEILDIYHGPPLRAEPEERWAI